MIGLQRFRHYEPDFFMGDIRMIFHVCDIQPYIFGKHSRKDVYSRSFVRSDLSFSLTQNSEAQFFESETYVPHSISQIMKQLHRVSKFGIDKASKLCYNTLVDKNILPIRE